MTRIERIEKMFFYFNSDLDKIMDSFILKYGGIEFLRTNNSIDLSIRMKNEYTNEVVFDVRMPVEKLKSMQVFMENELNRSYLNDLHGCVSRYSYFIKRRIESVQIDEKINPAFSDRIFDQAALMLCPFLSKENKRFLEFFQSARNSLIHHDGNHNKLNQLNYDFAGVKFETTDKNLGNPILFGPVVLVEMYRRLKEIFNYTLFSQNHRFIERVTRD